MKTAISLPDGLFEEAERLSRRMKIPISRLYRNAALEYVARHNPDEMTEAMNQVVDSMGPEKDNFLAQAAHSILTGIEW